MTCPQIHDDRQQHVAQRAGKTEQPVLPIVKRDLARRNPSKEVAKFDDHAAECPNNNGMSQFVNENADRNENVE